MSHEKDDHQERIDKTSVDMLKKCDTLPPVVMLKLNTKDMKRVTTKSLGNLLMLSENVKGEIEIIMKQLDSPILTLHNKDISQQKYHSLKQLLGKTDNAISCAEFCKRLAQYLQNIELKRVQMHENWRKVRSQNNDIKSKMYTLETDLFNKECKLIDIEKERQHWQFLCSLTQCRTGEYVCSDEQEMWNCVFFGKDVDVDIMNASNQDIVEFYSTIIKYLRNSEAHNAAKLALTWETESSSNPYIASCYKANMLILIAFHFLNECKLDDALLITFDALTVRIAIHGENHRLVAAYNNVIAFIYWKMNDKKTAAQFMYKALKCMENLFKDTVKSGELAEYYIMTGGTLQRYSYHQEGLRLVELGSIIFNSLLPKEESRWLKGMTRLSKNCNDIGASDDAFKVCTQVINYFHKKMCKRVATFTPSSTIIEVALKHQEGNDSGNISTQQLPKVINLSEDMISIIRELSIVFITQHKFVAARIIDSWLEECFRFSRNSNEISPKTISSTLSRVRSLIGGHGEFSSESDGRLVGAKVIAHTDDERRGDHREERIIQSNFKQGDNSYIGIAGDGGRKAFGSTGKEIDNNTLKTLLKQPLSSASRLSNALKKSTIFGSKKLNEWLQLH